MKKIIAIMLLGLQLSVTCACNKAEENPKDEPVVKTALATEELEVTGVLDEIDEEKEFSMGKVEGQTYKNEFIGIGCELDDEWVFYDEEKIKEINSSAMEMAGEDYKEAIEKVEMVYDMFAVDSSGTKNVSITLEKADVEELKNVDMTQYYETIIASVKQNMSSMGCTNINCEIVTLPVDGVDTKMIKTSAEANGTAINQTCISKKCNGYMANITTSSFGEDKSEEILAKFYWL